MSDQLTNKPRDPRALNAFRHGLTGQVHILTPDDQAAYEKHCCETHEYFDAAGGFETRVVQSIADDRWQLQCAVAIENSIFALEIGAIEAGSNNPAVDVALAKGRTWLARSRQLERLASYQSQVRRRVESNIAMFQELQAKRQAAFEKAIEQAVAMVQCAESAGEVYDPATQFPRELLPAQFDFSNPQIVRLIAHYRRLKEAGRAVAAGEKALQQAA
jgi:hypothetical protein